MYYTTYSTSKAPSNLVRENSFIYLNDTILIFNFFLNYFTQKLKKRICQADLLSLMLIQALSLSSFTSLSSFSDKTHRGFLIIYTLLFSSKEIEVHTF